MVSPDPRCRLGAERRAIALGARARRHTATTTIDMSAALTPGAVQKIRDSPSEATNVRVQVRAAR